MALKDLFGWNKEKETAPAACGTACGAGDNQSFGAHVPPPRPCGGASPRGWPSHPITWEMRPGR